MISTVSFVIPRTYQWTGLLLLGDWKALHGVFVQLSGCPRENCFQRICLFFFFLFTGRQASTDPQSTSTMSSKQSSNTFCPSTATKLTMNEGGINVNKMQNRKRQREHGEYSTPTTHKAAKVPKLNVSICVPVRPHFVQYSQLDSLLRPERLRKETVSNRRPGIHFWNISIYVSAGVVCPKIVNVYDSDIDFL